MLIQNVWMELSFIIISLVTASRLSFGYVLVHPPPSSLHLYGHQPSITQKWTHPILSYTKNNKKNGQPTSLFNSNNECIEHDVDPIDSTTNHGRSSSDRRTFIQTFGFASMFGMYLQDDPAMARGLVKVPCNYRLANTYHFFRAGQSLLEEEDVLSTNPLFLTNREAALSELGREQVQETCQKLIDDGIQLTIVRYSLAAAAIDTANIVGEMLKVGRDSLVPEFNFMDPRAVGKWDMLPLKSTEEAIWAMDNDEAGPDGLGGRPPANEDSTPHETLSDQVTRLRQLISVLETQYSGDTILLVFPDGTGPAVLECLIAGIPLNRVHELNYASGEIRLDITYDNVRKRMPTAMSEEYSERLARGREELVVLRKNPEKIINVKDQQDAEELRLYEEEKARLDALKKEEEVQKEREKEKLRQQMEANKKVTETNGSGGMDSSMMVAGVGVGAIGGGAILLAGNNDSKKVQNITSTVDVGKTEEENLDQLAKNSTELSSTFDLSDVNDNSMSNDQASRKDTMPMLKDEPKKRTEKQIEKPIYGEYLNIDEEDGGDAWLGMLSDIMVEDDNENEKEKGPKWADL